MFELDIKIQKIFFGYSDLIGCFLSTRRKIILENLHDRKASLDMFHCI